MPLPSANLRYCKKYIQYFKPKLCKYLSQYKLNNTDIIIHVGLTRDEISDSTAVVTLQAHDRVCVGHLHSRVHPYLHVR